VFRYDAQNMVAMGRWFLPVACAPSSFYDLPWLAGLLAILLHALGAVCICRIFSVKKKITAALIGASVVTFPTVTSVLAYNYVADGYALAFLLSCLAVVFMVGQKPRWWASVLCIALSAGIYQAYVTVTIMLLLCYLILEALKKAFCNKRALDRLCSRYRPPCTFLPISLSLEAFCSLLIFQSIVIDIQNPFCNTDL
jgi:hypothetical protein